MDLVSARWGEMDPEAHLASFIVFCGSTTPTVTRGVLCAVTAEGKTTSTHLRSLHFEAFVDRRGYAHPA